MNPRRITLRATLDQLTHDFAEAVLRAVRSATFDELAAMLGSPSTPRLTRRPTLPPPRSDAVSATSRRAGRSRMGSAARHEAAQIEEVLDHTESYHDVVIVDPGAVLGSPVPSPPAPPIAAMAPDDGAVQVADGPALRDAPPLRAGEDVLRAAGGGVVLRRRRSPRASEGAAQ